jgi:hypothetical protein
MVVVTAAKSVAMEAPAFAVRALADEEHRWLATTLFALLSLARFAAA